MKIGRHKKVQRFLNFYNNYFKFRQPYQLLIDGTFCFSARKEQINLKEQLPKYLGDGVKLLTTKCVTIEAETIAKKTLGALNILKQFGIHQCGHKTPVNGSDCILSMIGKNNSSHYVIATQDRALQNILRKIPGVPLMYLHKKTPTLEKPSDISYSVASVKEENCTMTESQDSTIKALKKISGLPTTTTTNLIRSKRKKKQKGANPLSCLKKKKKTIDQNKPNTNLEGKVKKTKKRIRVKVPTHIKNMNNISDVQ